MTNLMQQLQAWADEGLIVFPEGDYKGGLNVPIESLSPYGGKPEGKCTKDAWKLFHDGWVRTFGGYLQLVLDGTIQVWRPVEHYPPPKTRILCIGKSFRATVSSVEEELTGFWIPVNSGRVPKMSKITHWQPLPQPPQEVSHV